MAFGERAIETIGTMSPGCPHKRQSANARQCRSSCEDLLMPAVSRPRDRGTDSTTPTTHQVSRVRPTHARLEDGEGARREKFVSVLPHAGGKSREPGRAKSRRLHHVGPLDRNAEHVCLKLHQPIVRGCAAIYTQPPELIYTARTTRFVHRLQHLGRR